MSQKQQFDLLEKYLSGTATAAEIAMIDQWLQKVNINDQWNAFTTGEKKKFVKGMYEDIRNSIEKRNPVIPIRRKFSWMAAASVLLILTAAIWFWNMDSRQEKQHSGIEKNFKSTDILPGGNKATLTLADGSTIILDSANNGNISKQGPVAVIKLDDGQLAYQPETRNAKPATVLYNTISTPRGGQYQVTLADGSKVWLNAASSITFPTAFGGSERQVTLSGEAYFEVVHNAEKRFSVQVGDMKVQVLGTHFNINAYADDGIIKTTLLKGSVNVSADSQSVVLKPGQQAQLQMANHRLQAKNDIDTDEVLAWKNGYFQFGNSTLEEVLQQLSRWYDVQTRYPEGLPALKFGGSISMKSDLTQVFKILEESGVKFQLSGRTIVVEK